jgi:peroxiredoxin/outer membrane lipoprotein-sorting protein
MNSRALPFALACLVATLGGSHAQLAPIPRGPPGLPRPAGKAEGLTPEIEAFLKKVARTYAEAASYRDRGRVRLVQVAGRVKTTTETPMELTFERPNRLRLDAGQFMIVCDGRTLRTIAPHLAQYTEAAAPERLERKHLVAGSVLGSADEGHPELVDFFLQPDAATRLIAQVVSIGWKDDAEIEGARCRVLAYETAQRTKIVSYFDAARFLLLKVEAETLPEPASPDPARPFIRLLYEFSPVELAPKLDAAAFAFTPPPSLKRVNQLGQTSPGESDSAEAPGGPRVPPIIGKVAPALEGKDLAGQALAPGDMEGRTVLLFFWSIAGGQYCLNSIPVMQQIAERFAGRRGFLLLGINADPEAATTVGQLMERKKATFRTVLDQDMKLHRAFELEGVPSFVLLGADGKVKWALLGAPPTLKEDVAAEIEKLLSK